MPLVLADRVRETTTTTGQGTVTLAGVVTGFQSFSVVGNGNTTYYTIAGQGTSEWEVGIGTYTASGTTLSRDTVLASSAGAPTKTNFSAGTKDVFVTYTAARSVNVDGTSIDTFGLGAAQGDILYASGSDNFVRLAKDTNATRYLANTGTTNNPAWAQVNLANGVTGDLPFANLTQGSALSVLGVTGNAIADVASIAAGTDHQVLRRSGTALAFGAVNLAQSAAVTGTLPIANGGSGQTTAQAAMNAFAGAVTSGQYLRGNGTNVVMSAIQAADVPTLNQNTTGTAGNVTSISSAVGGTYTWTGANYFQSNQNTASGLNSAPLQAYSTGGNGAIMAFHRAGVYAINMGLDSDNVFRIGGWSASANRLQMDMSGNLTMAANVVAHSDERYKTNWRSVTPEFVEKLSKVRSGVYDRTDQQITQAGVSAQSLQELLPETVLKDTSGRLSVAYGNAALVACVELAKEVMKLRAEIDALKARG